MLKGSLEDQISEGGHLLIILLVFFPDFFLDFFEVVFYFLPVMVKGSFEDQISDSIIVRWGHLVILLIRFLLDFFWISSLGWAL